MGDGGGVTLSLLEEPFGCLGMVLMRVVDSRRRRRLSPRSHSRRWLLLSGHVSQRNILLLWTSKYPQPSKWYRQWYFPSYRFTLLTPPFSDPTRRIGNFTEAKMSLKDFRQEDQTPKTPNQSYLQ
jgi:hypothetical protein